MEGAGARPFAFPPPILKEQAAAPAPQAIFLSEGEQIRLGVGLLSIVWFAFFVVADSRLAHVEHQAEVSYLVASASLGLAWSGPLAVLAGMRLYPGVYDLWQPFYGGFVFVLLQAFGWLFYSCTLIFCILALANIASGQWHTTMVDGGFVAVGKCGPSECCPSVPCAHSLYPPHIPVCACLILSLHLLLY
ncbi:hypothetical protein T492DRAFT_1126046 [Pavlovales sp. CCMP2436]|nr:hypothetical protein T492DRAFT_1126046 [Pavlovales sp. CCMP2436]